MLPSPSCAIRICLVAVTVWLVPSSLRAADDAAEVPGVRAARGVIERLIGPRVADFRFVLEPREPDGDRYAYRAVDGVVNVRGTSPVALVRGAYAYLGDCCGVMAAWSGRRVTLPAHFPVRADTTGGSPFALRQYFNVCTFGYTTVWWDWARWEREIDWMALHGINMPLAMAGQEAIWQRVWQDYGIDADALQGHFTGPAFLPWHRMGNLNGHGGPLSPAWIDGQRQLQHRILARMRELGMQPVAPAFSGFVPEAFVRRHPDAKVHANEGWGDFPPQVRTWVLTPDSPLFADIGARFIRAYEAEYGPLSHYLADTFNELHVPVNPTRRDDELAAWGSAVYRSIAAGNPAATWVMQGWMFGYDKGFWDKAAVRALLRDVPDDRMLVLDLANEIYHGWQEHAAFHGKPWIYSVINNFGGNSALRGDLRFLAGDPAAALAAPGRGKLAGFGLAPEGVENNEVVYALAADVAWRTTPVDIDAWLRGYLARRYGRATPDLLLAWQLLLREVYVGNGQKYSIRHAFQRRPGPWPESEVNPAPSIDRVAALFAAAPPDLQRQALFRRDRIDVTVHALAMRADALLRVALAAHAAGNPRQREAAATEAVATMRRIDEVLKGDPQLHLSTWLDAARAQGTSAVERAQFERNARWQITQWGGPSLHDYAAKLWHGLVADFYARRWARYFDLLRQGADAAEIERELVRLETAWAEQARSD